MQVGALLAHIHIYINTALMIGFVKAVLFGVKKTAGPKIRSCEGSCVCVCAGNRFEIMITMGRTHQIPLGLVLRCEASSLKRSGSCLDGVQFKVSLVESRWFVFLAEKMESSHLGSAPEPMSLKCGCNGANYGDFVSRRCLQEFNAQALKSVVWGRLV